MVLRTEYEGARGKRATAIIQKTDVNLNQ